MKQIKFRKDTETPFSTKGILVQLLTNNEGGGSIKDMIRKVDLKERIEAGPDDGEMSFADKDYDLIKSLFESNKFPVNLRFFLDVYNDIENYTSVTEPKKEKEVIERAKDS